MRRIAETARPSLILVRTHIGFGSPRQDSFKAHGSPLGEDERAARPSNNSAGRPSLPFFLPESAVAHFREALDRGAASRSRLAKHFDAYANALANERDRVAAGRLDAKLPDGWDDDIPTFPADAKGLATRAASGKIMNAIAPKLPALFGGSADLDPSTFTALKDFGDFEPDEPADPDREGSTGGGWNFAGRNVHFGVREHAMGSISNGLAAHGGFIPYGATFLIFSDYMRPPIRLAALSKLHVVHVFTHDIDNGYDISVIASDGVPAHDTTKAVTINVTDLNEAPVITSNGGGDTASVNVTENSTAVTTVTATDQDIPAQTLTYSVVNGAGSPDASKFGIDGSGHLFFLSAPDFEAPGSAASSNAYTVQVLVADSGVPSLHDIQTITVNVQDANDIAPTFISSATPTVVENTTAVVDLTTTDPDTVGTNPATFSINAGLDGALFTITGSNHLAFVAPRDYETQAHSYSVDVTASDGVNTTVQHITVALADANDNAPIFSSGTPPAPRRTSPPTLPFIRPSHRMPTAPRRTTPSPTTSPRRRQRSVRHRSQFRRGHVQGLARLRKSADAGPTTVTTFR